MPETKQKSWFKRHWIITTILIIFIVFGVLGIIFDNSNNPSSQTQEKSGLKLIGEENNAINEGKNTTMSSEKESDETTECTGKIFEQTCINKKIDDCTKLCAGADVNIPVIKNECHSACYQVYYYGGEKDLDDLIKEYKGEK